MSSPTDQLPHINYPAFRVWLRLVQLAPPAPIQCFTSGSLMRGSPYSDFGENQLSPGSIEISSLPTGHPNILQHERVRASTRHYSRFTLPMGRSLWFRVYVQQLVALLRLAFAAAARVSRLALPLNSNSQGHSPKGTSSLFQALTVCRHTVSGPLSLPSPGCFSPFPHGTLRYRSIQIFSLGTWTSLLPTGLACPVVLRIPVRAFTFRIRDCHPLWSNFPEGSAKCWFVTLYDRSYNP